MRIAVFEAGLRRSLRRMATGGLVAALLALGASALAAPGAQAQSCHGTLAPAGGGTANDTKYSLSCDVAVGGRYTVEAAGSNGALLSGTVHNAGQGYSCSVAEGGEGREVEESEEGEEEREERREPSLSDWICSGGSAAAGAHVEGFFTAQSDPCAAGLTLRMTLYSGAERAVKPIARIALTISCSGSGSGSGGGGGGAAKPVIGGVTVSPAKFKAAGHGGSVATAVGALVTYKLSIAARATFKLQRASAGALSGGHCVALTKANRSKRRCTRYVTLPGSFAHSGAPGSNRFHFSGKLAGHKLAPGSYRFAATARAGTGPVSATARSATFKVVR